MNGNVMLVVQIILSVLLVILVLIQAKGTGLGSTFGGEMGFYSTKRGVERMLFYLTMAIVALFIISSLIGLLV